MGEWLKIVEIGEKMVRTVKMVKKVKNGVETAEKLIFEKHSYKKLKKNIKSSNPVSPTFHDY